MKNIAGNVKSEYGQRDALVFTRATSTNSRDNEICRRPHNAKCLSTTLMFPLQRMQKTPICVDRQIRGTSQIPSGAAGADVVSGVVSEAAVTGALTGVHVCRDGHDVGARTACGCATVCVEKQTFVWHSRGFASVFQTGVPENSVA